MTLTVAAMVAAALALAAPARAADLESPPALGQPIVLFPQAAPPRPALPAPVRRPVTAVQKIPLDGRPLIPPAPTAKLGPPPEPQPALSLETDLQPVGDLAPGAGKPPPGTAPPFAPAGKLVSG